MVLNSPPASLYLLPPPLISSLPPLNNKKSLAGHEKRTPGTAPSARDDSLDGGGDNGAKPSPNLNQASFAETARMFTLVCSNDQERHAMTTTYRHRFRLELRAVLLERRRNPARLRNSSQHHGESNGNGNGGSGGDGGGGGYGSTKKGVASSSLSPDGGNRSSTEEQTSPRKPSDAIHANRGTPCSNSPTAGVDRLTAAETLRVKKSTASSRRPTWGEANQNQGDGKDKGGPPREQEKGVTAEEFSEALVRCPEMLEAFGTQLAARFRHRHRPIWMAPFLRKGD